jgi:hypothetical protein
MTSLGAAPAATSSSSGSYDSNAAASNGSSSSSGTTTTTSSSSPRVPVSFAVPDCHLQFGENLRLVGSCPELGAWSPDASAAVPLAWTEGCLWLGEVALPPGEHTFKLCLVRPDGSTYWEPGEDRRLRVPSREALLAAAVPSSSSNGSLGGGFSNGSMDSSDASIPRSSSIASSSEASSSEASSSEASSGAAAFEPPAASAGAAAAGPSLGVKCCFGATGTTTVRPLEPGVKWSNTLLPPSGAVLVSRALEEAFRQQLKSGGWPKGQQQGAKHLGAAQLLPAFKPTCRA